jgi:hypothetical protein
VTDVTAFGDPVDAPAAAQATAFGDPVDAPPPTAEAAATGGFQGAAEAIGNDLNAGFQGVNPVAMQEAMGQAVGELVKQPGMKPYVAVYDGSQMAPLSEFPADKFATLQQDGVTYVIPRSATDSAGESVEEGPLASLGRLFGYGMAAPGRVGAAPAPKPAAVAAQDSGVTPSFAMGGPVRSRVAAAGEQFAPTVGPLRADAERVTGEIGAAATKLADRAGPGVTPFDAGDAVQRGGETFVKETREFQGALYDAVNKFIPPDTPMQATATMAALAKEKGKLRGLPNTITPTRLKAMEEGKLTWEQARALRTDIGTALRSFDGAETNVAKGQLDQIYKALSEDLDEVVDAAGPGAREAWTRANKYKRVSEERISTAFGKLLGDKISPEQAYKRLTDMAQEGTASANIVALQKVLRSLPEEDRAVVAGTIIRRMGRASAGAQDAAGEAFSADTFLTNWNKMSPEARQTIAGAGLDPGVGEGLTKLAQVVEKAKEAGTFRNRSNTGGALTTFALGGSFTQAPIATTAAAIASWGAAKLLTMPRLLHAVNRYAATGKIDGLERLAASEGPEAIEAANLLRLAGPEASSPQTPPREPAPATYSGAP